MSVAARLTLTPPCHLWQVFSGSQDKGPHALWELVDLGNGASGLRSVSNGLFLKVVAPKPDDWNAPWKVTALMCERERACNAGAVLTAAPVCPRWRYRWRWCRRCRA